MDKKQITKYATMLSAIVAAIAAAVVTIMDQLEGI
jgi:hypothetical protein